MANQGGVPSTFGMRHRIVLTPLALGAPLSWKKTVMSVINVWLAFQVLTLESVVILSLLMAAALRDLVKGSALQFKVHLDRDINFVAAETRRAARAHPRASTRCRVRSNYGWQAIRALPATCDGAVAKVAPDPDSHGGRNRGPRSPTGQVDYDDTAPVSYTHLTLPTKA